MAGNQENITFPNVQVMKQSAKEILKLQLQSVGLYWYTITYYIIAHFGFISDSFLLAWMKIIYLCQISKVDIPMFRVKPMARYIYVDTTRCFQKMWIRIRTKVASIKSHFEHFFFFYPVTRQNREELRVNNSSHRYIVSVTNSFFFQKNKFSGGYSKRPESVISQIIKDKIR